MSQAVGIGIAQVQSSLTKVCYSDDDKRQYIEELSAQLKEPELMMTRKLRSSMRLFGISEDDVANDKSQLRQLRPMPAPPDAAALAAAFEDFKLLQKEIIEERRQGIIGIATAAAKQGTDYLSVIYDDVLAAVSRFSRTLNHHQVVEFRKRQGEWARRMNDGKSKLLALNSTASARQKFEDGLRRSKSRIIF